jgi:hypothetical protein
MVRPSGDSRHIMTHGDDLAFEYGLVGALNAEEDGRGVILSWYGLGYDMGKEG